MITMDNNNFLLNAVLPYQTYHHCDSLLNSHIQKLPSHLIKIKGHSLRWHKCNSKIFHWGNPLQWFIMQIQRCSFTLISRSKNNTVGLFIIKLQTQFFSSMPKWSTRRNSDNSFIYYTVHISLNLFNFLLLCCSRP